MEIEPTTLSTVESSQAFIGLSFSWMWLTHEYLYRKSMETSKEKDHEITINPASRY